MPECDNQVDRRGSDYGKDPADKADQDLRSNRPPTPEARLAPCVMHLSAVSWLVVCRSLFVDEP